MNHPTEDTLLLAAYGELAHEDAAATDAHLAGCPACRDLLAALERARVGLDVALPRRRRRRAPWVVAGLAAAAVLAAVLVSTGPQPSFRGDAWPPERTWSATAGYVAGGAALVAIDSQLTRLEQEKRYARP